MNWIQKLIVDDWAWHKKVLNLTWPVIVSNLSIPLTGAVDTAVVGHLPNPAYIGAVALGALIFSTLYWLMGFLRMGTTGFVAQSVGSKNREEIAATFLRGIGIALSISLLVWLVYVPFGNAVLWFFEATQEVEANTLDYYSIRIWGVPFALVNLVVVGYLFGTQNMRMALVLQLLLNGMNIVLDLLFVLGFGWNVEGVAIATVISEVVTAICGVWVCVRMIGISNLDPRGLSIFKPERLRAMAEVNINIMIRTLLLEIAIIYFMWVSAKSGEIVLAANAVLMHLVHFLAFGLDGFAHAAEALAGRAFGAREPRQMRKAVMTTLGWSCIVAIIFALFYAIFGNLIIDLITGIESVRLVAGEYLAWLIFAPLVCVWPFLFDGVYIGTTRTVEMRNGMVVSILVFLLAAHFGFMWMGNHGLWLGFMLFMVVRGAILAYWYPNIEQFISKTS